VALFAIMALFRPSENNRLYAYSEQIPASELDEHTAAPEQAEIDNEPEQQGNSAVTSSEEAATADHDTTSNTMQ